MSDEDALGGASFGLSRVLADSGIDPSTFSSFFSKTGGGPSHTAFDEVDAASDEDAKYEDDVSDSDLPKESEEETRMRATRKAEEERWVRRAAELQRSLHSEKEGAERDRKRRKKALDAEARIKLVWPDYEPGKRLRMSEIFYETPLQSRQWQKGLNRAKRKTRDKVEHPFGVATRPGLSAQSAFLQQTLRDLVVADKSRSKYDAPIGAFFDREWVRDGRAAQWREVTKPPNGLRLDDDLEMETPQSAQPVGEEDSVPKDFDLADWEKNIVFSSLDQQPPSSSQPFDALAPRNAALDTGDWLKDVIWDATRVSPGLFELDEELDEDDQARLHARTSATSALPSTTTQLDQFNLSNDHLYEHSREARYRIRQTFGAIEVFHAGPARDLQMPFYKTTLSKAEARAWRRPALQFPTGINLSFTKAKSNPSVSVRSKKKALMTDPSERFKTTKDLTMAEKGPYVLMEFSEEYPPIMSGYGMGTTIVNYYRKKDDKDEHVPKLDFGQPSILNVGDAEPFMLCYVDRGKVTQIIHNNLIRAPIYRHQPETTDFLVVRQTINGHTSYYLRAISNLFVVGQTVPNESEIPGPHARKNTNTSKERLMITAWLMAQKTKGNRVILKKLVKYFPDQNELQIRQRLKIKGNEFLSYARAGGPQQGTWTLNPEYDFPKTRKEVLDRVTPEAAMLYEAMQVGQRHLHDAGYSKTAEGKDEDEFGDDAGLDVEQQLAVWHTTMNYKRAEQQKAWIMVHGEGDPTGRGEGFSFLRLNMKGYFLRKGETEQGRRLEAEAAANGNPVKISNAAQQQIYEEEKRNVWDLQGSTLGNPIPPELTAEDEVDKPTSTPAAFGPRFARSDSRRAMSRGASLVATPMESPGSPSAFSQDDGSTYDGNSGAGKIMRIQRLVKGKPVFEIVRDPAVIKAYMKKIEENKLAYYMDHPDELQPSGDTEEDEIKKAALRLSLEKYKKNQLRRQARKKSQRGELPVYEGDDEVGKRRCGACGQLGHTKANRMCPMYNANSGPSPAATTPGAGTPGVYGMTYGSASHEGSMPPPQEAPTSLKIRLGTGRG